jgi:hypothetical protein
MKKMLIIAAVAFMAACGNKNEGVNPDVVSNPATANGTPDQSKLPKFEFEKTEYNFGEIMQGQQVTHEFKFKNTGGSDLVITNAVGSCGCTVPEFPKDPVKPGNSGIIKVTFNSDGKQDEQNKTVTLTANTQPTETVLYMKGFVKVP